MKYLIAQNIPYISMHDSSVQQNDDKIDCIFRMGGGVSLMLNVNIRQPYDVSKLFHC